MSRFMDLHKIHHPDNFEFLGRLEPKPVPRGALAGARFRGSGESLACEVSWADLGEDVFRIELRSRLAPPRLAANRLAERLGAPSAYRLKLGAGASLALTAPKGRGRPSGVVLEGEAGATFGFSGPAWMVRLRSEASDRFFGMGEKWGPLEKGGRRNLFWTTDVWADYPPEVIGRAEIDCAYAVIPYLIIERQGTYFGLLLDSPYRSFMATNPRLSMTGEDPFGADDAAASRGSSASGGGQLYVGSTEGPGVIYLLVGPDLRGLTQKLQRLVGVTPRPPLWALGHQQCRWGYRDFQDLARLDAELCDHRIPTCGLWLDIDYMDGFRVFTTAPGAFPERVSPASAPSRRSSSAVQGMGPSGAPFAFEGLRARGRHVVPILDPGVKVEPGYRIYDQGIGQGHFCLSPSGRPYVGIVWPGRTHFPDFSQTKTRTFWANEVCALADRGFDGFWIDMNDPSTGPIENRSMLFDRGRRGHEAYHNQYGLLMAMATHAGLKKAFPTRRPFVLSRSGFTGMARYSALWTGDNVSSFRHLQASIPTSLNLALSGIPMNGPDVPGFGGDAEPALAVRFYQATFLFPFLRNHSVKGSRAQEPWAFGADVLKILRQFIWLRYRLLPYLYQLFVAQEEKGDAILAPLFIDEAASGDLRRAEDQFFIGRLLCAPVLDQRLEREIFLPSGHFYCLRTGKWLRGGARRVDVPLAEAPLFVREGTILPLTCESEILDESGGVCSAQRRLGQIELHVFLRPGTTCSARYVWDDGESVAYRRGQERRAQIEVRRDGNTYVVHLTEDGSKQIPAGRFCLVIHGCSRPRVLVDTEPCAVAADRVSFSGGPLSVARTGWLAPLHSGGKLRHSGAHE